MRCPHCHVSIHPSFDITYIQNNIGIGREHRAITTWSVNHMECPSCQKAILVLKKKLGTSAQTEDSLIYPRGHSRLPAKEDVPECLAEDFNEAASVLNISPKASAALTRRCLQQLLVLQGFNDKNLADAIGKAIPKLPQHLADILDAVRNIGNFATHPLKNTNSGEIIDVDPEEAEWNLEVLESLFDFYYVQPAISEARKTKLNEKLATAGKPPMKE